MPDDAARLKEIREHYNIDEDYVWLVQAVAAREAEFEAYRVNKDWLYCKEHRTIVPRRGASGPLWCCALAKEGDTLRTTLRTMADFIETGLARYAAINKGRCPLCCWTDKQHHESCSFGAALALDSVQEVREAL